MLSLALRAYGNITYMFLESAELLLELENSQISRGFCSDQIRRDEQVAFSESSVQKTNHEKFRLMRRSNSIFSCILSNTYSLEISSHLCRASV